METSGISKRETWGRDAFCRAHCHAPHTGVLSCFKSMHFRSTECRQQLQLKRKLPAQHSAEHHVCSGRLRLDDLSSASLTAPAYWEADRRAPAPLPALPAGSYRRCWFQLTFQLLASLAFLFCLLWNKVWAAGKFQSVPSMSIFLSCSGALTL